MAILTKSIIEALLTGTITSHNHSGTYAEASHTHDDRYYTETEMNNGQMDSRYYTETESDNKYALISHKHDQSGSLPTASEAYRGKIYLLQGGAGVADIPYICRKNASDTYEWFAI